MIVKLSVQQAKYFAGAKLYTGAHVVHEVHHCSIVCICACGLGQLIVSLGLLLFSLDKKFNSH